MKRKFIVEGMTCAICSGTVEKVVGRVRGVKSARVNLSAKTLYCDCDTSLEPEAIIHAVEAAGFSASVFEKKKGGGEDSRLKKRLIASAACTLPVLYLSMAEMLSLPLPPALSASAAFPAGAFIELVLVLCVFVIGRAFFIHGFQGVKNGAATMDTLVSLGAAASFLFSALHTLSYALGQSEALGEVYFESAAMIFTLVTLGNFLEARAKARTAADLHALTDLSPETVRLVRDEAEETVPPETVRPGDLVRILPGERVPVDGEVTAGESTLDNSALTGESMPADVTAGARVLSGALNLSGTLTVRASKPVSESTLSAMIALVEEAGVTRAPAAKLADRIASVFVPAVTFLAVLTTVLWCASGEPFGSALGFGICVLVISCPCALGLATPVAVTAALGKCAASGVLVRTAEAFDRLTACDTILLDKTGTLTEGKPEANGIFTAHADERDLLRLAASLEQHSEHPLASAVCRAWDGEYSPVSGFQAVFGKGVRGKIEGQTLLGGSAAFLEENGVDLALLREKTEEAKNAGKTVLYFAREGEALGALALSDALRPAAPGAVRELLKLGKEPILVTGDQAASARAAAEACGISRVEAGVLPQDKAALVKALTAEGKTVLMAGDGINDAPALKCAALGVSLGGGTDIAQNAADVILLQNDLSLLPKLHRFAKKTGRIIRQNLFWAFFYNACAIPVAAGALYPLLGVRLSPMLAAACMCVSSLFVVTNALRLYRGKELS